MKSCIGIIIGFLVLVLLVVAGNSYFIVNEGQKAIVTRFGAPSGEVREPGLNFKTPFIEDAIFFDTRIMKWDGEATQIPTKEKSNIFVDCTARWRIADPLRFLQTVGDISGVQNRMNDVIDSAVRVTISSNYLSDIVRSDAVKAGTNIVAFESENPQENKNDTVKQVEFETRKSREEILNEILEKSRPKIAEYGVELIDFQIKKIIYTNDVLMKIYASMKAERNKEAAIYRSEGEASQAEKKGQIAKELSQINSEATLKINEIKGKAEADAARIYAEAYSKDPEFYAFYRSLESLEKITESRNAKLVISTDSDLYKYIKKAKQ